MFHTGWKGKLLLPRNIRLFVTDERENSVLYWRYKKKRKIVRKHETNRQAAKPPAGSRHEDLGAEDRHVSFTTSRPSASRLLVPTTCDSAVMSAPLFTCEDVVTTAGSNKALSRGRITSMAKETCDHRKRKRD